MQQYRYWTYILTNWNKTVLYTGVTNNLAIRLIEHWIGLEDSFTSRYKVHHLVWSEESRYVLNAIDREKSLKNTSRELKLQMIAEANPAWLFQNSDVVGNWPPTDIQIEEVRERWRKETEGLIDDPLSFHQRQVADKYNSL
jgi:putative endonuclease